MAGNWEQTAKQAYMVYAKTTNGKMYRNSHIPDWNTLPIAIKEGWIAAAKEVVRVTKNTLIDEGSYSGG